MFTLIPEELLIASYQVACYCLVIFTTVVTWIFVPRS